MSQPRTNNHQRTINRARTLRQDAPFPERLLWSKLRNHRMNGLRWRRQHPIGSYITDFCCVTAKLVIELDGRSHETREIYDKKRTAYIESQGFRVIRFGDDEIVRDIENVLHRIASELEVR
ncbi:MAG: DUF559 domain-containing protein [Phycisphaerales bacterium]|nr:DUF559 domain-containing protein [Phycisphaerales bacterium]